jgi:putative autotransporter adhesin-like protein
MERRLTLFWPLVLIAAGVLWILIDLGRIPASNLWALAILWPFLLIAAGLGLIVRPYWRYAGVLFSALVVVGLFLAVLFAAQFGWNHVPDRVFDSGLFFAGPSARGSGNVVTQSRTVRDFSAVHVAYPAHVLIRQGPAETLTIEAEDNVAAAIQTRVANHTLVIDNVRDHNVVPSRPINITITVKDLTELNFDSAGDITVQGLETDHLKTDLNGAGGIKFENLSLKSLEADLSGVGSLEASGKVDTLDVRVDGMGSFEAAQLQSQDATVKLDGVGSANVWADGKLAAYVNGLGSINYYGRAQVSKSVNGLGSVHFMGTK